MNNHKYKNILFKVKKIFYLIIFISLFLCGCEQVKFPVKPSSLISKSKEEILDIIFSITKPNLYDKKITIHIQCLHPNKTHYIPDYYRFINIEEALKNKEFMDTNIWQVSTIEQKCIIGSYNLVLTVHFNDNKVYEYTIKEVSDAGIHEIFGEPKPYEE